MKQLVFFFLSEPPRKQIELFFFPPLPLLSNEQLFEDVASERIRLIGTRLSDKPFCLLFR